MITGICNDSAIYQYIPYSCIFSIYIMISNIEAFPDGINHRIHNGIPITESHYNLITIP